MTDRTSISFHTSNMDEHEKNLMTGTLEQRKEAFKEDEELMRETTKFISEVIETAATEASKRKAQSEVMCELASYIKIEKFHSTSVQAERRTRH